MIKFLKRNISSKLIIKATKFAILSLLCWQIITLFFKAETRYYIVLSCGVILVLSFLVRNLIVKSNKLLIPLYILDFLTIVATTYFEGNIRISTLYVLILSDFYLSSGFKSSIVMSFFSFSFYVVGMILSNKVTNFGVSNLISFFMNDFILFALDFIIVNLFRTVLIRNEEIEINLETLRERELSLKEAYNKLEEVTILEERNRIAKEIHDTVGHSITTIIMQTEAAKLIISTDVEDAKNKIISANMQATTALEELRESVKVLSGYTMPFNLEEHLLKAIEETCSETQIKIKYKLQLNKINIEDKKARFIYSTFKEGLNNGIRHGKSTAFYFEIIEEENTLKFLLSDNGKGVNLKTLEQGFGLTSMRDKCREFCGEIYFKSYLDDGFEIDMSIPL